MFVLQNKMLEVDDFLHHAVQLYSGSLAEVYRVFQLVQAFQQVAAHTSTSVFARVHDLRLQMCMNFIVFSIYFCTIQR